MSDTIEDTVHVHEMCRLFPQLSQEEATALKESIRQIGLQEPVTFWRDEDGVSWLIDGFNRYQAVEDLLNNGITKADNGTSIQLDSVYFEGTEDEALEYVEARNGKRRHLKSSQLAAIAVLTDAAMKTYLRRNHKTVPKVEGDYAEHLAKRWGTNRQYVYDCLRMNANAQDRAILNRIAQGELTIPQAETEIERRKNPPPADTNDKPAEPATTEPAAVLDGLKNEIHDPAMRDVFKERSRFRDAAKKLRDLVSELDALSDTKAGKFLRKVLDELKANLKATESLVNEATPHTPCLVCDATGKKPDSDGKRCEICLGNKFVDRAHYRITPAEFKPQGVAG